MERQEEFIHASCFTLLRKPSYSETGVKTVSLNDCKCRCVCTVCGILSSIILGIAAALLNICHCICLKPIFFRFLFAISVVYLAVLIVASALQRGKQTRVEHDTPENEYFTHLVMLSALPYVSMPAASSYTMYAKYSFSGSSKF